MGSLSDADKERCRYHTGYMETSFAGSMSFGLPRPIQTMFMLEQALGLLVNDGAIARVIGILNVLDATELRIANAQCVMVAEKLGDMTLRGAEQGLTFPDMLEREYTRWAKRLADILGVPLYPYAQRFKSTGATRNVPVR